MLDDLKKKIDLSKTEFTINGQVYDSFDDMPEELQEMFRDEDGNKVPDIIDEALGEGVPKFIQGPLKKLIGAVLPSVEQNIVTQIKQEKIEADPLRQIPTSSQPKEQSEAWRIILFLVIAGVAVYLVYNYSGWF